MPEPGLYTKQEIVGAVRQRWPATQDIPDDEIFTAATNRYPKLSSLIDPASLQTDNGPQTTDNRPQSNLVQRGANWLWNKAGQAGDAELDLIGRGMQRLKDLLTKSDVIQAARTKWPQYQDVPDEQLFTAVTNKFPQYIPMIDPASLGTDSGPQTTDNRPQGSLVARGANWLWDKAGQAGDAELDLIGRGMQRLKDFGDARTAERKANEDANRMNRLAAQVEAEPRLTAPAADVEAMLAEQQAAKLARLKAIAEIPGANVAGAMSQSTLGKTVLRPLLKSYAEAEHAGSLRPETMAGRFVQKSLPQMATDLPIFIAGAGANPAVLLGGMNVASQGADLLAGDRSLTPEQRLHELAQSVLMGAVLKGTKIPGALSEPTGGAVERVLKSAVGKAIPAATATYAAAATGEKVNPETFLNNWATFVAMGIPELAGEAKGGYWRDALTKRGVPGEVADRIGTKLARGQMTKDEMLTEAAAARRYMGLAQESPFGGNMTRIPGQPLPTLESMRIKGQEESNIEHPTTNIQRPTGTAEPKMGAGPEGGALGTQPPETPPMATPPSSVSGEKGMTTEVTETQRGTQGVEPNAQQPTSNAQQPTGTPVVAKREILTDEEIKARYLSSTPDVKQIKAEKDALQAQGFPVDQAAALVEKHYDPAVYADLEGKNNVYLPVPSTSGANILPKLLAERLARDFGGKVAPSDYAVALHETKAAGLRGVDKLLEPRRYGIESIPDVPPGSNVVLVEDVVTTGDTIEALEDALAEKGIQVDSVASLGQAEKRLASAADFRRLGDKIGKVVDIPGAEVQSMLQRVLGPRALKHKLNNLERDIRGKNAETEARTIYETLRTRLAEVQRHDLELQRQERPQAEPAVGNTPASEVVAGPENGQQVEPAVASSPQAAIAAEPGAPTRKSLPAIKSTSEVSRSTETPQTVAEEDQSASRPMGPGAEPEIQKTSGGMAKPGAPETQPTEIRKAEENPAAEPPATKSAEEQMKEFVAQRSKETDETITKGEKAGFLRVRPETRNQTPEEAKVARILEAGRVKPANMLERAQVMIDRAWTAFHKSFVQLNPELTKDYPVLQNEFRTDVMPMRRKIYDAVRETRQAIMGVVDRFEKGAGVHHVMDLIWTKDLIARGKEGQTLPGDTTLEDLQKHLDWLEKTASPEIKKAEEGVRKVLDLTGQSLVERGKLSALRDAYAPHQVIDYMPAFLQAKGETSATMQKKFGEPYRSYTKKAIGSNRLIETSEATIWSHIAKVQMDNAMEDWFTKQTAKYDRAAEWRAANPGKNLKAGMRVTVDGKQYQALRWKRTFMKLTAVNEDMLNDAREEDLTVREWEDMRGVRGGKPMHEAIGLGRDQLVLVPEPVAKTLNNIVEYSDPMWDLVYCFGAMTRGWKGLTLRWSGLPYELGNLMGDSLNTALFDPAAFRYTGSARKIIQAEFMPGTKPVLNETEKAVQKMAREQDVLYSGPIGEVRRYGAWQKATKGYQDAEAMREGLLRVAIMLHQYDRVQRGLKVQRVAGINTDELPTDMAIGKLAREALVDYASTPRLYKRILTNMGAPFVRFHEANFRNHLRAAINAPLTYLPPVIGTAIAGWAWNNTDKKRQEVELQLPKYIRNRFHLILWKDKETGKEVVWAPQQPVDIAWSWLGLNQANRLASEVYAGRMTMEDAAKEMGVLFFGGAAADNWKSIRTPLLQWGEGLTSNTDPFDKRRVMPDEVFKLWKSGDSRATAARLAAPHWVRYTIEKLLTPVAAYMRQDRSDEPTDNRWWQLLKKGPLNVRRALGFYDVNLNANEPIQQVMMTEEAKLAFHKDRIFRLYERHGLAEGDNRAQAYIKDLARDGMNLGPAMANWRKSPSLLFAAATAEARNAKTPEEHAEWSAKRDQMKKVMALQALKATPKAARPAVGAAMRQERARNQGEEE